MSERGRTARVCAPCRVDRGAQGTDAASSHRRATSANGFGDFCQDKSHPPQAEAVDPAVAVAVATGLPRTRPTSLDPRLRRDDEAENSTAVAASPTTPGYRSKNEQRHRIPACAAMTCQTDRLSINRRCSACVHAPTLPLDITRQTADAAPTSHAAGSGATPRSRPGCGSPRIRPTPVHRTPPS